MSRLARLLAAFRLDDTTDLHHRLYQAICLVIAVFGGIVVPAVNLTQPLPLFVSAVVFVCGVIGLVLFRAARHGREYPTFLYLSLLVASVLTWFPNAGSQGSVVFYLPTAALLPIIFAEGWRRNLLVSLVFLDYAALMSLEWLRPEWVTPYVTPGERMFDHVSGFVVSLAAALVIVAIVIAEYRAERRRLEVTVSQLATSREQMSRSLQEAAQARARLATLIDSTEDLVWLAEADDCRLTLANAAFARVVAAQSNAEVRPGMTPEELLPAPMAAWWRDMHARALAEGHLTAEYTTDTGHVLLLSCHRIEVENRRIGVSMFGRDITEQVHTNEERARLEQELLQSQKMESLGSLAGGVAHDFNNMLTSIMGHADLLLGSEVDPARRGSLQAIVRAATRSAELTKKLLAFARRGKNIVEPIDLGELARDSLAMLRPSFHPQLVTALALDSTWTVDGDPSQLQQVLVNLCLNASEAMPAGGTLTLSLADRWLDGADASSRDVLPGPYVELTVADTGQGMSDEVTHRAFEPFFTTKDQATEGGTGLGLPTVYGIVQLHKGSVALASTPGRGTTVTVLLPRGTLQRTLPEPVQHRSASGLVLVVDDEELLRDFTGAALARLGYSVVTAPDGEAGVATFRARHHELEAVILDLKMPRMSGREAFAEMHIIDPAVPVLICSGYGDNEEAQGLISRGAAGLLGKPFKIAELSAQLQSLGAHPVARS